MFKKCSLCGGRLENGRCTFCGLDNSVYDRDYERNNSRRQSADTQTKQTVHPEQTGQAERPPVMEPRSSREQRTQYRPRQPGTVQYSRRAQSQTMMPQKKKTGMVTVFIILAIIGIALLISFIPDDTDQWADIFESDSSYHEEYDTYDYSDYDPYEYVTRDIPAEGETYETVLGNGIYRVGVHIPEGIYRVELSEGLGSLEIEDEENSIYHYVTFGTDEEYDQVTEDDDIRLYNGADLLVDSGVILRFVTENAQPLTQEILENPLTEPVSLEAGTYTAGSDTAPRIPQGIYDISALDEGIDGYGYSSVTLTYPNGSSEYLWIDGPDYAPVTDEAPDCTAKNIVIVDGTEISVEYGRVTLMPGEGYYDVDYTQYTSE